jgi:predicted RNA binding protein YcfA (HicA-like mRNA interferase family)
VPAKPRWPATKAGRVLAALLGIGWSLKRSVKAKGGPHRVLERRGYSNFVFAFHDSDEIGPPMLARIGKKTGLTPEDL